MAAILLLQYATGAQSNAKPGCIIVGKEESIPAFHCARKKGQKTTILTLCDEVTRCKTTKEIISKDRPCPSTTKPSQAAHFFKMDPDGQLYANGKFWDLNIVKSLSKCQFAQQFECSQWSDEVLYIAGDHKKIQKIIGDANLTNLGKVSFILAGSTQAGEHLALYNINKKTWIEDVQQKEDELPECE